MIKLLLFVPYDKRKAVWSDIPFSNTVKLVCSAPGSDCFDEISLSNTILKSKLFFTEGSSSNVARRWNGNYCSFCCFFYQKDSKLLFSSSWKLNWYRCCLGNKFTTD
jgi:hypothetical protein